MQIDLIKNQIGGLINGFLAQKLVTPTEMRYVLKAIQSEVAELELTESYIKHSQIEHKKEQSEHKQEQLEENNE